MTLRTRSTDRIEDDITKSLIPLTMDEMDENFLYLYDKIVLLDGRVGWISDLEFETLSEADSVALASNKTLFIYKEWTVVPTTLNADIYMAGGALNNSNDVTINGLFKGSDDCFKGLGLIQNLSEARPEWWGIDGVSDQIEINKAIQSVVRGEVLLRGKTYIISDEVSLNKEGVNLKGVGAGNTIIKIMDYAPIKTGTSTITGLPFNATSSAFTVISVTAVGSTVSGLTADGNWTETGGTNSSWLWNANANYGVSFLADNGTLENVECRNITGNGCGVPIGADGCSFINVHSHHNGKKGLHSGKVIGITIIGGHWHHNIHDSGIGVHQGALNLSITGAHIHDNYYGINAGESYDYPNDMVGHVTISNNIIYDNKVANIFVNKLWDEPLQPTATIQNITNANPAVVNSTGHGRTTGQTVKITTSANWGMTQINGASAVILVIDSNNFSLTGIDSTSYSSFSYGSWKYVPTQAEWDATGLDENTIEHNTTISNNILYFSNEPTPNSDPVSNTEQYCIQIYSAKNTIISNNVFRLGGILNYNGINTIISNNIFSCILNEYTTDNLIYARGISITGSHPNHLTVINMKVTNNIFDVKNVTRVIDTEKAVGSIFKDNSYKIVGGAYEIHIRDVDGVNNSLINESHGRIKLVSDTTLIGYNQMILPASSTNYRPIYPTSFQQHFDTTLNKLIVWNGTVWKDGSGTTV